MLMETLTDLKAAQADLKADVRFLSSQAKLTQVDFTGTPTYIGTNALGKCAHKVTLPESDGDSVVPHAVEATN